MIKYLLIYIRNLIKGEKLIDVVKHWIHFMSVQRNGRFLWFWHGLDSILLLASFGLEYCICVSELQLINCKQSCCFLFCFAIDTLCISLHVELWFEIQVLLILNKLVHSLSKVKRFPSEYWLIYSSCIGVP